MAAARLPIPRGRALVGALLFGVIGFAASYAFFYAGIVHVEAGLAQVLMSLIPLLTVLFAVGHRVEVLSARALAGAGLATIGIAVVSTEQLGLAVPLLSVLAIVASAACAAEAGVLVKAFPRSHLVSFNAVSMATGAALLLALSVVAGERVTIPLLLGGALVLLGVYVGALSGREASSTARAAIPEPATAVPRR